MNSTITTKNKEKLDLLLNKDISFKNKKDLLEEKRILLTEIRNDVNKTYMELNCNMPVSCDEYGNDPEKISYTSYAAVKGIMGFGTGLFGAHLLSEYIKNSNNFSGWDYGLMPVMFFVSTFLMASAINDYKSQKKMDNTNLVVNTIDDFLHEKKLDLKDLDKIYHSEFQYVVSLMASMNCVEARKIRYVNYLRSQLNSEICRRICEPEENSSF